MIIPFLKDRPVPKAAVLAVVTLVAVAGVVTGREKPALEVIEQRVERPKAVASVAGVDIDLSKLDRSEVLAPQNDPFARRSFAPAPAQQASAAPAAPAAPPLPFRYFGKVIENGKLEVFVMRGDDVLSIAAGQKIDADYRVERISDTAISFTYLPLKTQQTMDLPERSG